AGMHFRRRQEAHDRSTRRQVGVASSPRRKQAVGHRSHRSDQAGTRIEMTFIVTRRSEAGEDRWNAASSSEIIDVVVRDLVETGSGFPTEDGSPLARQDREYAARAAAVLLRVDFPPFPKTKTIYGNSYTVEEIDRFTYPVELKHDDNGTILVIFPDVPGT